MKKKMMYYLSVQWIHNFPDEPVMLYSELDEGRYEVRKVEIYANGSKGYASRAESFGGTELSETPLPEMAEIGRDAQFVPAEISAAEFEVVWNERTVHE